jgi:hypothetical protein
MTPPAAGEAAPGGIGKRWAWACALHNAKAITRKTPEIMGDLSVPTPRLTNKQHQKLAITLTNQIGEVKVRRLWTGYDETNNFRNRTIASLIALR